LTAVATSITLYRAMTTPGGAMPESSGHVSRLCAPNYCRRYRPAARHAELDTSTSHVDFRGVVRAPAPP
jgi:formylglycine-generating enzyme required for sulfatase activity